MCREPAVKEEEQEIPLFPNEIPWPLDDEEIQRSEYSSEGSDDDDDDDQDAPVVPTRLGSTQRRSYESGTLSYGPVNPSTLTALQLETQRSIALESKDLTALVLFDRRAGVVEWSNGYRTFLPFLASNEPDAENDRACVSSHSAGQRGEINHTIQEEDFVRSMATLNFFTPGDAGMLPGRVVKGGSPLTVARDISNQLATGRSVHVRPSIHTPVQWSLSDFRNILGLHAAGIVRVQGQLLFLPPQRGSLIPTTELWGTRSIEHSLGGFIERCQQYFLAVIDHPVRDTGMPRFTA